MENGHGKYWKMHIERSWKVMENHFQLFYMHLEINMTCMWLTSFHANE